jgi:mRNA-decapping enzyme subunit 2
MNADCSKFVLCRVWNGKSFTFPAGKINQGEDGMTAAARETYEETGFDPSCSFGLSATWKQTAPEKISWKPMREKDALVYTEDSGKRRTSYVVAGVPEDFPFEPVARKEVSLVTWYGLDDIPKPSFGVLPFVGPLRRWIKKHKKMTNRSGSKGRDRSNRRSTPKKGSRSNTPRKSSRGRVVQSGDELVTAGLASAGDTSGWSEEAMFQANEKLLGHKVEYDGNPHVFAEQGFAGKDPHAFRVVGGTFLNSGIQSLAPPPDRSMLQPLFRSSEGGDGHAPQDGDGLTPFFSNDGETPWGEVVQEACGGDESQTQTGLKKTRKGKGKKQKRNDKSGEATIQIMKHSSGLDDIFLTDAQITAKSQAAKAVETNRQKMLQQQLEEDTEYIRQWVANLPVPRRTKHFGEFKLDVDRIMAAAAPALGLSSV